MTDQWSIYAPPKRQNAPLEAPKEALAPTEESSKTGTPSGADWRLEPSQVAPPLPERLRVWHSVEEGKAASIGHSLTPQLLEEGSAGASDDTNQVHVHGRRNEAMH